MHSVMIYSTDRARAIEFTPGYSLRLTPSREIAGHQSERHLHAGAGYWREYGDVQRGEFGSTASSAVPFAGAAGHDLGDQSARGASALPGGMAGCRLLERAEYCV